MATNNCGNSNCGCTNTYTVTAPCPPSCPEVFNASCIVYTGTDILCNQTTVISRYDYLDTIITKLVDYICNGQTVTLTSAGGTETLVNDGVGPALVIKGLNAGTGISLTGTATAITITNTDPGSAVTLTDAGTTTHESLVNDGVGPALATKGLKAGTGISLSATATDITITNTVAPGTVQKYATTDTLPGAGTLPVTHNLGTTEVIVSVIDDNTNIALVHGVDYTWATSGSNNITISDAAFGGGAIRVTVIG